MKKTLLIALFLFFTQVGFAQYFTLTSEGFKSADKTDYVVLNFPNVKQAELYSNVLNVLNTMYKNPKEVLSLVEGQSITIKGYEEDAIDSKEKQNPIMIGKRKAKYDVSYTLSILFKDGKIRFNSPSFECRKWVIGSGSNYWAYMSLVKEKKAYYSIYDKKGELVAEEAAASLNKHFNTLIKEILDKSNNINNW